MRLPPLVFIGTKVSNQRNKYLNQRAKTKSYPAIIAHFRVALGSFGLRIFWPSINSGGTINRDCNRYDNPT